MNPRTKIKVTRSLLISAIEEKYAADVVAYEKALVVSRKAMGKRLQAAADKVVKDAAAEAKAILQFDLDQPEPDAMPWRMASELRSSLPDEPPDPSRVLAQLGMSPDDTISLSVEDFERYL